MQPIDVREANIGHLPAPEGGANVLLDQNFVIERRPGPLTRKMLGDEAVAQISYRRRLPIGLDVTSRIAAIINETA